MDRGWKCVGKCFEHQMERGNIRVLSSEAWSYVGLNMLSNSRLVLQVQALANLRIVVALNEQHAEGEYFRAGLLVDCN